MGWTQRPYDFRRSRGEVVSRMERLGARSKTAYRESGTNRFNPIPITGKGREIRFSPAISRSFVVVSSIWLQLIWLTVGSTVKTRDLVKLNNNSIPTVPSAKHCCCDAQSRGQQATWINISAE